MAAPAASSDGSDPTSVCIAGAVAGDAAARDYLVERFTPVLLVQARYRMRELVRGAEPEDVVQETWAAALPKLRDLLPRDGRWTPVLLKFLSVILLRAVNDLLRRSLRRRGGDVGQGGAAATGAVDLLAQVPAAVTGIVTRLARSDRGDAVQQALAQLAPEERDVVVLRGIEQLPNRDVAKALGIDDSVVTRRFQRALQRLRDLLPGSLFEELDGA